jgi:hypothetical protein
VNSLYVGPGYYVLVRSQVADGEGYQVWREAVHILSKQSRSTDKGVSPNFGFVRVLKRIDRTKKACYVVRVSHLREFFGTAWVSDLER